MQARIPAVLSQLVVIVMLVLQPVVGAVAAETLVVGLSPDYEPLAFKDSGKLVGIEPDNAHEIGAALGMKVRFVEMPFEQLLPALASKKIDVVMSGLSITEERKTQVAYVEPFMQVGQMAIIRNSDIARFGYPRAIYGAGVRVGVEPGTTGAMFVQQSMLDVVALDYSRPEEAFAALRANQIDVYIHDAPTSWRIANSGNDSDLFSLYRLLTDEQLAWAVRKDDRQLLDKLNKARTALEGSGRLRAIQDFWIPVKVEVK
jgi:ABC-type amino acid transport substrate-binding protein